MPTIFGDTDDIAFGESSPKKIKERSFFSDKKPIVPARGFDTKKTFIPRERSTYRTDKETRDPAFEPTHVDDTTPALTRLIDSMKPTFLPSQNEGGFRIIPLTSAEIRDVAFLVRSEDTSILYGSGFSTEIVNGQVYPTFPDMRLVFSEKERLAAWILADESIEVSLLQYILPTLDFPPVYASRGLIAKIRDSLKTSPILDKCRFFELFTADISDRKIAGIEVSTILTDANSYLAFRAGDITLYDSRYDIGSALPKSPRGTLYSIRSKEGRLFLQSHTREEEIQSGEIISLGTRAIERHSLRFTFDTFYVDKQSIGVVAGYTLKDRKELGEHGVLTFVLEEDRVKRAIIAHIYIDSRGFVHSHEMLPIHKEILKGIRATYEKAVMDNPRIERAELVQAFRREITKYCYLLTGRTPVVMPIVLER